MRVVMALGYRSVAAALAIGVKTASARGSHIL
jgi:hypothetical protein